MLLSDVNADVPILPVKAVITLLLAALLPVPAAPFPRIPIAVDGFLTCVRHTRAEVRTVAILHIGDGRQHAIDGNQTEAIPAPLKLAA